MQKKKKKTANHPFEHRNQQILPFFCTLKKRIKFIELLQLENITNRLDTL